MAVVDVTGSGNVEVVAATSGKRIRVINYTILSDAATTVTWKSAATALSGAMSIAEDGGVSANTHPSSQTFSTAAGEALNMTISNTSANVRGHLEYLLD